MPKKIVITGGTGLIGKALCKALLNRGYEVFVLTRSVENGVKVLGDKVRCIYFDKNDISIWGNEIDNSFAIINLAGESIGAKRWNLRQKKKIVGSRVETGSVLVRAIANLKKKPDVFIQASAVGFYGNRPGEELTEESSAGTGFLSGVCREWESSTDEIVELGIRRVVIRTGGVLGDGAELIKKLALPFKLYFGGPLGNGKQMFPWIHLEDEVGAILHLMESEDANGPYNLVAPGVVSNKILAKTLGRVLAKPSWLSVPSFVLKIALGEMAKELVLIDQNVKPIKLIESGFKFQYENILECMEQFSRYMD